MRKRFERDDVTPATVKVTIGVFVLLGWGVAIWWRSRKYGGVAWIVEVALFGLVLLVVAVSWIVGAIRRRLRKRVRDPARAPPEERRLPPMRRHGGR